MRRLVKVLATTVGRKFVMAITGLLLCGFLVVHLAGNVFLFVGADAYNNYAHSLHKQEWLVKIAELGLYSLFAMHIGLALNLTRTNRSARGSVGYEEPQTKQSGHAIPGGASSWMLVSGFVVLLFLILHITDFTLEKNPAIDYGGEGSVVEPFDKAVAILTNPVSAVVYMGGCLFLAVHLVHGFASAFQTLGVNHPRFNCCIQCVSYGFGWLVSIGFMSCVIWAWARVP